MPKVSKIIFIWICFVLIGCDEPVPIQGTEIAFLEGDYEWVYSINQESYDVTTNQEVSDQYGIRITGEGFFYTFKNSNQEKKYRITDKREGMGDNWDFLIYWTKGYGYGIHYSGDTIMLQQFPFSMDQNFFIKVR
jgi:hypothetical protein